jgi:hypothetical protein
MLRPRLVEVGGLHVALVLVLLRLLMVLLMVMQVWVLMLLCRLLVLPSPVRRCGL